MTKTQPKPTQLKDLIYQNISLTIMQMGLNVISCEIWHLYAIGVHYKKEDLCTSILTFNYPNCLVETLASLKAQPEGMLRLH